MHLVRKWLRDKSRNYAAGVSLYVTHGTDNALKRLFTTEAETAFKRQRLFDELSELAEAQEEQKQVEAEQHEGNTVETISTVSIKKKWPRETIESDVELSLWERAILLLKQISNIHSTLVFLPDDQQRQEAAFQLLRMDEELDEIYSKRDYFRKYGHLPKAPEVEYITDPMLIAKRMINLHRYINRNKKEVNENPGNAEAAQRLKTYREEYNYYAEKMGKELC